jgi:hypothetical protein
MSTLSSPVRMQLVRSWLCAVLAIQIRLFYALSLTTLKGRVQRVGAVSRATDDLSHVAINARPSAIRRSCTTALRAESLAHVSDQPVTMNALSFVVKIVAFA